MKTREERYIERAQAGDPLAWEELVRLAQKGDKPVEEWLCKQAGRLLTMRKELPLALDSYVAGGLVRRGEGGTWNRAFRPMDRQPPEVTAARKRFNDMGQKRNDKLMVDFIKRARASDYNTAVNTETGELGSAFVLAAEHFGLASSTARDRYYAYCNRNGIEP